MIPENEIKRQILRQACDVRTGTGLAWNIDHVANAVAVELVREGFVSGSVSDLGTACITGIRDKGRVYLETQKPRRKFYVVGRRMLIALYSLAVLVFGYIMTLDSVRTFFSDFIGRVLM